MNNKGIMKTMCRSTMDMNMSWNEAKWFVGSLGHQFADRIHWSTGCFYWFRAQQEHDGMVHYNQVIFHTTKSCLPEMGHWQSMGVQHLCWSQALPSPPVPRWPAVLRRYRWLAFPWFGLFPMVPLARTLQKPLNACDTSNTSSDCSCPYTAHLCPFHC